jgi:hypothetical protein
LHVSKRQSGVIPFYEVDFLLFFTIRIKVM